jgi:CheY-like chemotaxis protein
MDRILIVEDEPELRNSISRFLGTEAGYLTHGAGSLREALLAIDEHLPALIVADLDLPDGTGLDLLREMNQRGKTTPIVFITAFMQRFADHHPDLVQLKILRKPFEPRELIERVQKVLGDGQSPPKSQSAFTVADYLQLAGLARRSVELTVSAGGLEGTIVVQNGNPVWAQDQFESGSGAFNRLAMLDAATIACNPCEGFSRPPNLSGSLEHLLLEAARGADESSRGRKLPPAPSPQVSPSLIHRSSAPVAPPPKAVPRPPIRSVRSIGAERANTTSEGDASMPEIKPTKSALQILTALDALSGISRADELGSVCDKAGELDAETAAAVATLAGQQLVEVVDELGLGQLASWHVSLGQRSWFVVKDGKHTWVGGGPLNKNAAATLKKVQDSVRGQV